MPMLRPYMKKIEMVEKGEECEQDIIYKGTLVGILVETGSGKH